MARVAIVGAGLSGLTAGYRLQTAGWQVDVFEAANSPGGRVQTVRRDGYAIDTGASALGSTYTATWRWRANSASKCAPLHRISEFAAPARHICSIWTRWCVRD